MQLRHMNTLKERTSTEAKAKENVGAECTNHVLIPKIHTVSV